jgi:hypothetical protein
MSSSCSEEEHWRLVWKQEESAVCDCVCERECVCVFCVYVGKYVYVWYVYLCVVKACYVV